MTSGVKEVLKQFVEIDLSEDIVSEPAANALRIAEIIGQETHDLPMDVEPANFVRLLHDLAPEELKKTGDS